jgi:hypothetical protein
MLCCFPHENGCLEATDVSCRPAQALPLLTMSSVRQNFISKRVLDLMHGLGLGRGSLDSSWGILSSGRCRGLGLFASKSSGWRPKRCLKGTRSV